MTRPIVAIFVLAAGSGLFRTELTPEARARCDRALALYREQAALADREVLIVVGGGQFPSASTQPIMGDANLKDVMQRYMEERGVPLASTRFFGAWNTWGIQREMLGLFEHLREDGSLEFDTADPKRTHIPYYMRGHGCLVIVASWYNWRLARLFFSRVLTTIEKRWRERHPEKKRYMEMGQLDVRFVWAGRWTLARRLAFALRQLPQIFAHCAD